MQDMTDHRAEEWEHNTRTVREKNFDLVHIGIQLQRNLL